MYEILDDLKKEMLCTLEDLRTGTGKFLKDLDRESTVTNRDLLLGVIACVSVGMVIGMLSSPKKQTIIGSCNGSNTALPPQEPEKESEEAE